MDLTNLRRELDGNLDAETPPRYKKSVKKTILMQKIKSEETRVPRCDNDGPAEPRERRGAAKSQIADELDQKDLRRRQKGL